MSEINSVGEQQSKKPKKRCIVYVDGFNLYYGVLRHRPDWKWLNLETFFRALRPDEEIVCIKYCTAEIDPDKRVSVRRDRQKMYFNALETLETVHRIEGKYQLRDETCRANGCNQGLEYKRPEEKKTDVNLAIEMVLDAIDGKADTMILVSGDSDQEPAVAAVRKRCPHIKVIVYIPVIPIPGSPRMNHNHKKTGALCGELPLAGMSAHQLASDLMHPKGNVLNRPAEWG